MIIYEGGYESLRNMKRQQIKGRKILPFLTQMAVCHKPNPNTKFSPILGFPFLESNYDFCLKFLVKIYFKCGKLSYL